MAQSIPSVEPAYIRAGDTIKWTRSLADYPASTWTLSYRLINAAGNIDITATADGDDHAVTVPAATSAAYTPGQYEWVASVTDGSDRYTVGSGRLTIQPDLAAEAAGYEARSTARQALADLRSALATWLSTSGRVQSYTVAGRSMTFVTADEIRQRIGLAEREVAREEAEERLAAGMSTGKRVLVRF